jgi:flagellar biosynthesis protein FlhF
VAALVGPTGVGKTTTIAKLAARAQLLEGRAVALVTVDDQRLGAATHLRAYADVLGVPVVHASAPGGLARALAELRDAELVLIDTAGISPSRPELFGQLGRRLQRAGEPVTTHLCVAAATRHEELDRLVHLYGEVEPSALLMTKADEAVAIGSVFGAQHDTGLPFSFVTTGQQVPDDIAQADPGLLIDLLLGGARA